MSPVDVNSMARALGRSDGAPGSLAWFIISFVVLVIWVGGTRSFGYISRSLAYSGIFWTVGTSLLAIVGALTSDRLETKKIFSESASVTTPVWIVSLFVYWILRIVSGTVTGSAIVPWALGGTIVLGAIGAMRVAMGSLGGGIAGQVLDFVPCLLLAMYSKLSSNARTTWRRPGLLMIVLLEISVLLMWYFLPASISYVSRLGGKPLLQEPVYTNRETSLDSVQSINSSLDYAVTASVFVISEPSSLSPAQGEFSKILSLGDKPSIEYRSSDSTLRVRVLVSPGQWLEVCRVGSFQSQRWNRVIVNFNGGTVDCFVNGDLVGTRGGVVPIGTNSAVSVGEERGALCAIKDVVFYDSPLSGSEIFVKDHLE